MNFQFTVQDGRTLRPRFAKLATNTDYLSPDALIMFTWAPFALGLPMTTLHVTGTKVDMARCISDGKETFSEGAELRVAVQRALSERHVFLLHHDIHYETLFKATAAPDPAAPPVIREV